MPGTAAAVMLRFSLSQNRPRMNTNGHESDGANDARLAFIRVSFVSIRAHSWTHSLALLFLLDRLLRAALGLHEAAHVAAGAGGLEALGLGFLRGRRDGLVGGAADDLADVALDALARRHELGLGVGPTGARRSRGGSLRGARAGLPGAEPRVGHFLAHAPQRVQRLAALHLPGERERPHPRRGKVR